MNRSIKAILLLPAILLFSQISSAQLSKVLHQSFEIDSTLNINLNLFGDYEIHYWEGNTVLTETTVELSDASPNILKHFIKMGRYQMEMNSNQTAVNFDHKDLVRKPIYTKNGQAWENIALKVYIPDVFSSMDDKHFTKTEELEAQAH